jgi:hypothetical protein
MKVFGTLILAGGLALPAAVAGDRMPAAQQNELVAKYCASCHDDAKIVGGLTLQRFDAAHVTPSLAAMMASKLKGGALGASGLRPLPDRATENELTSALSAEGATAMEWTVESAPDPKTQAPILTASILQEAPVSQDPKNPDLYRLKLTCRTDTHEGEMQVAWAPRDVPQSGAMVSAAVDGQPPTTHKAPYYEGNVKLELPMPARTLTIGNVFPNQTVVFPFERLTEEARQALGSCFARSGDNR